MGAMMKIDYEMRTSCYLPMKADNVLSKINTDYDSGLCAALASLIIHI